MDAAGQRALNAIASSPLLHVFRRPIFSAQNNKPKLSLLHRRISLASPRFSSSLSSSAGKSEADAFPNGEAASNREYLQLVLVSPQIPGNTGCIARTCAASAVKLHLVEPLGFQVDDAKHLLTDTNAFSKYGFLSWRIRCTAARHIKTYVVVKVHSSWPEFREYFMKQDGEKRLLAFTKRGTNIHSEFSYKRGDWLVFGSETSGLPPDALVDCKSEALGGGTIRIPMVETYVRCLNLSVSVGIALYEASRQLNHEQLQLPSEPCANGETSFLTEDIFA